jgi:hypothetical protein
MWAQVFCSLFNMLTSNYSEIPFWLRKPRHPTHPWQRAQGFDYGNDEADAQLDGCCRCPDRGAALDSIGACKVLASQTENEKDADGMFPARIAVDSGDFIATAIEQARWNQKAAFALAAVFQAVGIMIPG